MLTQVFSAGVRKTRTREKEYFLFITKSRKFFLFKLSFSSDVIKSFKLYFCSCNFIEKYPYQSKLISALTETVSFGNNSCFHFRQNILF